MLVETVLVESVGTGICVMDLLLHLSMKLIAYHGQTLAPLTCSSLKASSKLVYCGIVSRIVYLELSLAKWWTELFWSR